jgi:hypothetical protein
MNGRAEGETKSFQANKKEKKKGIKEAIRVDQKRIISGTGRNLLLEIRALTLILLAKIKRKKEKKSKGPNPPLCAVALSDEHLLILTFASISTRVTVTIGR